MSLSNVANESTTKATSVVLTECDGIQHARASSGSSELVVS